MNEHIPNTHNFENENNSSVADELLKSIELAVDRDEVDQRYLEVVDAFKNGAITPQENSEIRQTLEYKMFFLEQAQQKNNETINNFVEARAADISVKGIRSFLFRRKK